MDGLRWFRRTAAATLVGFVTAPTFAQSPFDGPGTGIPALQGDANTERPDSTQQFLPPALPARGVPPFGTNAVPEGYDPAAFQPVTTQIDEIPPPPAPAPGASSTAVSSGGPMPPTTSEPQASPASGSASSALGNAISQASPFQNTPPKGVSLTPPGKEYPTVKITGFFQADAVWFDQTANAIRQAGDAQDGWDFRRARLAATGNVWENVGYMIEMDFATAGRPSFMDVYMDLRDMPYMPGTVRIGQWRMPFGMTSMTSVRELQFLERPLPFAFAPFRQIGIGLLDDEPDDNATWAVTAFRFPTDQYGDNIGDTGGYSMATRETVVFTDDPAGPDPLLHLGGDFSFITSSYNTARFATTPEAFVGQAPPVVSAPLTATVNTPFYADTGLLSINSYNLYGAELGTRVGSFHTQSEVFLTQVDRIGAPNNFFWGAYTQIGYVLTGEVTPYSKANGVFTRVIPKNPVKKGCGCGAWEVLGRWSTIDLNDHLVQGGQLTDFTAGLNWYLNARTKIQFNYVHAFLDRVPIGGGNGQGNAGTGVGGGGNNNDTSGSNVSRLASIASNTNIFAVRAQVDF
jgi:phosphate-selective porin OprO/OprP